MTAPLWGDAELRAYAVSLRDRSCCDSSGLAEEEARDQFLRAAHARLVPAVQLALLGLVGATTDADGVALIAHETLADGTWDDERRWLIVSTDPWPFLAEWVTGQIVSAYKAGTKRRRAQEKVLAGITKASQRAADGASAQAEVPRSEEPHSATDSRAHVEPSDG